MGNYEKELEYMIDKIKNTDPLCSDLTLINSVPFLYPFSKRLSNFIAAHGYHGPMKGEKGIQEKIEFVHNLYQSVDPSDPLPTKRTITSWFRNTHAPTDNTESKKNMYKLCFALHLTAEEVKVFFRTVYLQRAFYCRNLQEAVYYYSFLHNYHYQQATKLYETVKQTLSKTKAQDVSQSYTRKLKTALEKLTSEEELIIYLTDNQKNFLQYNSSNKDKEPISNNQTAREQIESLIAQLCGTEKDKELIQAIEENDSLSSQNTNPEGYGYAIREHIHFKDSFDDPLESLRGKTRKPSASISLLIYVIFDIDCIEEKKEDPDFSFAKRSRLHQAIRCNFPSKWVLSNILSSDPSYVSDDKVRKALILLEFYTFWAKVRLASEDNSSKSDSSKDKQPSQKELFDTFVEELNQMLEYCCFDKLYCKNPYDFLYLYASYSENPLDSFRDIISDALEKEE